MILKSTELNTLKLNLYNFYLFYGVNEGLKEETIKNLFEINYLDKIYRYEEKEILDNIKSFFENVLTKSFFDNKKLVIINRATDKIRTIIEDLMEKNPEDLQIILNSKNLDNLDYDVDLNDGVITFKNINTTLGFVRYNETAEVEYIFVNPMFRRQGLAKKLLSIVEEKTKIKPTPQDPISPLGEKLFKINKQEIN